MGSVAPDEVDFFDKTNFDGNSYRYHIGDDVNLYPGALNDKFNSVIVGSGAKVLAWQHANASGVYRELTGKNPSMAELKGLSRFKVIDDDTRVIAFLFKDTTGGDPKQYSLKLDAADVGEKLLYSNEDDDYKLVGTIPDDGTVVTTALYLRDEKSGQYLAIGSVYFQWNKTTTQVDIVSSENFPKQLKSERAGPTKFVVTLISNEPST